MEKIDLVAFGIIIDDLVFPDGKTYPGLLGGGGPQSAFGMRLWGKATGIAAGVGPDLPPGAVDWLDRSGIDLAGLRRGPHPTPRAWQITAEDGSREQVWQVSDEVVREQLGRSVGMLPPAYRSAAGFHVGIHPEAPDLEFFRQLRALGGVVSVEPFRPAPPGLAPAALLELGSLAQIFSPNLEEARSMSASGDPADFARRMLAAGTEVFPLRLGREGALIFDRKSGNQARIPACPVKTVDPTGAGNAFCGGFLAGWVESQDFVRAGLYGSVAASFVVETIGVPLVTEALIEEAGRRFTALQSEVAVEPSGWSGRSRRSSLGRSAADAGGAGAHPDLGRMD